MASVGSDSSVMPDNEVVDFPNASFIVDAPLLHDAKTTPPKRGNAAIAAFLKNSLRDWISSFVFFSSIIIEVLLSSLLT